MARASKKKVVKAESSTRASRSRKRSASLDDVEEGEKRAFLEMAWTNVAFTLSFLHPSVDYLFYLLNHCANIT